MLPDHQPSLSFLSYGPLQYIIFVCVSFCLFPIYSPYFNGNDFSKLNLIMWLPCVNLPKAISIKSTFLNMCPKSFIIRPLPSSATWSRSGLSSPPWMKLSFKLHSPSSFIDSLHMLLPGLDGVLSTMSTALLSIDLLLLIYQISAQIPLH